MCRTIHNDIIKILVPRPLFFFCKNTECAATVSSCRKRTHASRSNRFVNQPNRKRPPQPQSLIIALSDTSNYIHSLAACSSNHFLDHHLKPSTYEVPGLFPRTEDRSWGRALSFLYTRARSTFFTVHLLRVITGKARNSTIHREKGLIKANNAKTIPLYPVTLAPRDTASYSAVLTRFFCDYKPQKGLREIKPILL